MDGTVGAPARPATRIQALNRQIILDAGLAAFAAHGFKGTTLDRIAAQASMSKANLLYYFPRKEDIYVAVLEATLEGWLAPLEELDAAGDPIAELQRYIDRKLAISAERPQASRLFAGEILNGAPFVHGLLETRLRLLVEEKARIIADWMEAGRLSRVDPVHLIFGIWAVTQHYADFAVQVRAVAGPRADRPDFAASTSEAVVSLLLNGLRPR